MLNFTSINFAWYVLAVLVVCQFTPRRHRWLPLLVGSYVYYLTWQSVGLDSPTWRAVWMAMRTWDWIGVSFLLGQTIWAYFAGRTIERAPTASMRRAGLIIGLIPILAMLAVLKYTGFIVASAVGALHGFGLHASAPTLNIYLPVGISFFTFAHAGYLVDVFKKRIPAEPKLGYFALFGSFFPQVISGPIPRAGLFLPQVREPADITDDRFGDGGMQVLWGLFKKLVIADRLAIYVKPVFADVHAASAPTLALAAYFFAVQIYCDFSGYTDIAIGVARVVGIDLGENFRRPYFSQSVGEFWHRWHISLSTWFRDYLYIPLGGSRVTLPRWMGNVMVVFVVSGLWHGASWTYVIWGGLHGIYLVIERLTKDARDHAWKASRIEWLRPTVSTLATFHLVLLAWVFFRADSLSDAVYVIRALPYCLSGHPSQGNSQVTTLISLVVILMLVVVETVQETATRGSSLFEAIWRPLPVRWCAYVSLIIGILLLGVSSNGFIYGKF